MDGPRVLREQLTTQRTHEGVAQRIIEGIRSGDLHHGDRLPSERKLADQLSVSRTTVRDAIKRLREAGVLHVKAGSAGGTFVSSDYVPPDILEQRSVSLDEVPGLFEARRLLEPRVAQLAALYATQEDFRRLAEIVEVQRDAKDDPQRFIELDIRFHMLLARATGNTMIIFMAEALFERMAPIMRDLVMTGAPPGPEESIAITERTLSTLRSGDQEQIEAVMLDHIGCLEELWESRTHVPLVRRAPAFLRSRTAA
jgi:GntR family transcriptional repressor for pyruvate dehydrogenase complex